MKIFQPSPCHSILVDGTLMAFEKPIIMGILNVTPDSFYDGGDNTTVELAVEKAKKLLLGGTLDDNMFATVAKYQVPYILMHMRGIPENMQEKTDYNDIVTDVATFLGDRIATLRSMGVKDIILDPGFGFAKTVEQNYELLYRVNELHYFELPILGGISRKSMIYKKIGITAQEALNGTTALNTLLLERGVQILRVHDVKEAKQLVDLFYS